MFLSGSACQAQPPPCEVGLCEVFLPLPISPIRKLRLGGITPIAQGPTAGTCWSWALNSGLPDSEAGLLPTGNKTRKTERCVESSPEGAETCGPGEIFPWTCFAAKDPSEKTCQLVQRVEAGADALWKCLHRFQGTYKHHLPSLGVNVLYDFCSPGKY